MTLIAADSTIRGVGANGLYRRWIAANAWAEAAGLGTTFVAGWALQPAVDRVSGAVSLVLGALLAVLLGTVLEGVLVGWAQEIVLRQRLPSLRAWSWTRATAIGAALAWALGMVPSTVIALTQSAPTPSTSEPDFITKYSLAAGLGFIAGPILGAAQWTVLRRFSTRASRWLLANALAWAVGMPLVFAGMDIVPWNGHPAAIVALIYMVCGTTGSIVGAIHGRFLLRLVDL